MKEGKGTRVGIDSSLQALTKDNIISGSYNATLPNKTDKIQAYASILFGHRI